MSDDLEIGMDRDTSAPKNKMKRRIPRTLNSNKRQPEVKKKVEKPPSIHESEKKEIEEKEEEQDEEQEEEEEEKDDKIIQKEEDGNSDSSQNNINDEEKNDKLKVNVKIKKNEKNEMLDAMCQVNLTSLVENKIIQELKLKINTLENEKEALISQLKDNQKRYEEKFAKQNKDVNNLSLLNNKLKKNLDKVNNQVSQLLNQVVANNSIQSSNNINRKDIKVEKDRNSNSPNIKVRSNEENKDTITEIKILNEKLKLKENQIKDFIQTIESLKKENKKLKEDYNAITSDGKNINQNHKLILEIKKKNSEIRELEKEYKTIISSKSETKQIEYYKNKVKDLQNQNEENKIKINNFKQILEKYQKKEMENKNNLPAKNFNSSFVKNNDNVQNSNNGKISKIKIIKEGKLEYIVNELTLKKYLLNKNFSLLFNDFEKRTLFTLFLNEGDFEKFNQKLDILDNNFNSASKRFQSNINELKRTVDDKDELISYLREKIRENEMKIKILLNQIHLERNKNEKRANNQNLNDKSSMLNKTRVKSPKNNNN